MHIKTVFEIQTYQCIIRVGGLEEGEAKQVCNFGVIFVIEDLDDLSVT